MSNVGTTTKVRLRYHRFRYKIENEGNDISDALCVDIENTHRLKKCGQNDRIKILYFDSLFFLPSVSITLSFLKREGYRYYARTYILGGAIYFSYQ